jgi:uncharacterized membrane protein (DUF4010 family)
MDTWSVSTTLFLALILGAVIGLEREVNEKKTLTQDKPSAIVGLRSFAFIALLGAIVGLLYANFIALSLLIGSSFMVLLLLFYLIDSKATKDAGITTDLAMIFSFLIGILLALKIFPVQLILALTIVVVVLLSQKERIKVVVEDIQKQEINAFISFAVIAAVILPFLPNKSYGIADIPGIRDFLDNFGFNVKTLATIDLINPFRLWLIVALITGVNLVAYILEKTIGRKKGWLIASAVGGFVSSTATTQSIAQESRKHRRVNHLVSGAILANLVSFFQVSIIIGALNMHFLIKLFPVLSLMIITAASLLFYFLSVSEEKGHRAEGITTGESKEIINIGSALKFAVLFFFISIFSKIALEFFGKNGFLAATGIGSVIGIDAVMINTAQLAGKNINFTLAALAFILANAVNLFGKSFYSFLQGKREFAIKFFISVLFLIISSLLGVLLI